MEKESCIPFAKNTTPKASQHHQRAIINFGDAKMAYIMPGILSFTHRKLKHHTALASMLDKFTDLEKIQRAIINLGAAKIAYNMPRILSFTHRKLKHHTALICKWCKDCNCINDPYGIAVDCNGTISALIPSNTDFKCSH
jgi:hypothetical protein